MRHFDPVRLFLTVLAGLALCLPLLNFAPNRLFPGEAIYWLHNTHGWLIIIPIILLFCSVRYANMTLWAALTMGLSLFWLVGESAQAISATAHSATARVTLSSGFWLLLSCMLLLILDAIRREAKRQHGILTLIALFTFLTWNLYTGKWSDISLVREYHSQNTRFLAELYQHIRLVGISFILVLLIGFPLGWWLNCKPWATAPVFSLLNSIQSIPSLALFALLLTPLSNLARHYPTLTQWGIGGIGVAPAIIALVLYTLLPLVRNTYAAFHGIDRAIREAARGMGMSLWQIWHQVELPLALPVILSGIRIVLVQSIGLAVIAGLIGAGGLGTFIWQGLGQYAMDLVLLGAIPTILLALTVDIALQWLMNWVDTRRKHA